MTDDYYNLKFILKKMAIPPTSMHISPNYDPAFDEVINRIIEANLIAIMQGFIEEEDEE